MAFQFFRPIPAVLRNPMRNGFINTRESGGTAGDIQFETRSKFCSRFNKGGELRPRFTAKFARRLAPDEAHGPGVQGVVFQHQPVALLLRETLLDQREIEILIAPVDLVADNRMPEVRQMDADLMLATRARQNPQQGKGQGGDGIGGGRPGKALHHPVSRLGGGPVRPHRVLDGNDAGLVLAQVAPLGWISVMGLALVALCVVVYLAMRGSFRRAAKGRPTWDCGYASPTPRMQYTAGSFAGIITGWFDWILRPQRHARLPKGYFPTHAEFAEHTPETVLEKVVEPAGSLVLRLSTSVRRLQHGRVQSYIFYLLLGLAALAILAVMGGAK